MKLDLNKKLYTIDDADMSDTVGSVCVQVLLGKREQNYQEELENWKLAQDLHAALLKHKEGECPFELSIETANRLQESIKASNLLPMHKVPAVELIEAAAKADEEHIEDEPTNNHAKKKSKSRV